MDTKTNDTEELELDLLATAVHRRYGYDFRDYARTSLARRVRRQMEVEGAPTICALLDRVLHDPEAMDRLLLGLTVHVTSMFRDPGFHRIVRERVIPHLRTWPFLRIWHAGCSTGEEVYSLAILLAEEGLADRCRVYATDLSESVLARAKRGVVPLSEMKQNTENYLASGGRREFSDYYAAHEDLAAISPAIRDSIVFAQHNLVTDASFNEFHLVVCRNVMIYFNRALQDRVHGLLYDSLSAQGVLGLGRKESIKLTPRETCYEAIDVEEKVYRKVR